jgi:acetyl-CoA synthetase
MEIAKPFVEARDQAPARPRRAGFCAARVSLAALGIGPSDRILLMLGNVVPLWETMLAAIKLGAVVIPTTTLLQRDELRDRMKRGCVKVIVTHAHLTPRFEGLASASV